MPKLSVILPVFNGRDYLTIAIESVLSQSFADFELIIVNDGSTDDSAAIIEKMDDSRIRFFQQTNHGLAATLNRAISLARGEYIARQDQDDMCLPSRLGKQVAFLDAHADVGMVGTAAEIWVGADRAARFLRHPADDAAIKFALLFNNCFVHSSVMIRRSVLDEVGGYSEDPSRQPPEDYELWSRIMKKYRLANLPEVLTAYREVQGSMSRSGLNPFVPNLVKISAENIAWATGLAVDAPEVVAVSGLSHGAYESVPKDIGFAQIRSVLSDAALRIAQESGAPPGQLDGMLRSAVTKLRYHYLDWRSGGLIKRILHGRVGARVKGAASHLLGRTHV